MNSKLGLGPMSSEIIEAVFRYSDKNNKQLMLIASKNQIDYNGGYVNKWTTSQYIDYTNQLKNKYPSSDVKICRDHCGPGFNKNYDLADTYKTIKSDIESGFDLIHVDFCHYKGSKQELLTESKKAIGYCLNLNPKIELEIGTDENTGAVFGLEQLVQLEKDIDFFKGFCNPLFYVVQTGSLIKEINQVGKFNDCFVKEIAQVLHSKKLRLKEHNADYLTTNEIEKRKDIVDAMNIAPQLGVIQTQLILQKCLVYGIDFSDFSNIVYSSKKWEKWLQNNTKENKHLCTLIAGHYHFASEEYSRIIEKLNGHEDANEMIINTIMEVINHYENNQ